jgi:hypothetical protein
MPTVNPDGTVQVAPPTQSAFAPQPTQAPPPVPQQAAAPSPGFAGALLEMIQHLMGALKPGGPGNAGSVRRVNDAVDAASQGNDPNALGNQIAPK